MMYNTNSNKKHSSRQNCDNSSCGYRTAWLSRLCRHVSNWNKYKRICIIIMTVFLMVWYPASSTASAASASSTASASNSGQTTQKTDFLLVYDDNLTQQTRESISSVADILTYLGYSVCYRSESESTDMINNYPYILFYHVDGIIDSAFLTAVAKSKSKILTVGGGDITDLIKALKLSVSCTRLENTSANVTYSFSGAANTVLSSQAQPITLLKGTFSYSNGSIIVNGLTSPYCVRQGRLCSIAVYDSSSELLKAMLAHEIALWKWPYNDALHSYAQYIVFDNVYPFFNTKKMMDVIDMMKDTGVPYVITVMPIYQNGDYPAMEHFCEVLRYAQANGAAIALKEPIINTDNPTLTGIDKSIRIAFSAYCNYGVYPVALETSEKSIHQTLGLSVMRRFRTVILTPDDADSGWSVKEKTNAVYTDGHQLIAPAFSDGNNKTGLTSVYPTAVFLDMLTDLSSLRTQVQMIQNSSVPLMSLWSSPQSVYTDNSVLSYQNGTLTVNKKAVSLTYTPFTYKNDFNYHRDLIANLVSGINASNRSLMIIVTVISVLFIAFIVIARYQNRKNFFYKSDNKNDHEKESKQ